MKNYTHLIYSTEYSPFCNDYKTKIIGVTTSDIFHTIGEYVYRNEYHIKRITFVECTKEKLDFWNKNNYKITEFKNKYN